MIKTPVLADAIEGGVYLRTQASADPESGDCSAWPWSCATLCAGS